MKEILTRLNKWRQGETTGPEKVQLYPTNRCNLNCIFCAQRNEDYGYDQELSQNKWEKTVHEICKMDPNRILISGGGEPFCRKDTTLDIMEIIKENEIHGRLITNGVPLNKKVRKKIIEIDWDDIVFSIDGPDAKTHDQLRGRKGTFNKTIQNLRLLKKEKEDKNPRIEINFVLTKTNYRKIPEMVNMASEIGLDSLNFEPLTVNNPLDRNLKISKNEKQELVEKIIPQAIEIEKKNGNLETNLTLLKGIKMEQAGEMKEEIEESVGKTHNLSDGMLNAPCYEPWLWPKIEANGDVWPCSTAPLQENIRDKPFKKIWFGDVFQDFRERMLNHDLPEHCQNCVTTHLEKNKEIRKALRKEYND